MNDQAEITIIPGHPDAKSAVTRSIVGLAKLQTGEQIPVDQQPVLVERLVKHLGGDPQARRIQNLDAQTTKQIEQALQQIASDPQAKHALGQLEQQVIDAGTQKAQDEAYGRYQKLLRDTLNAKSPDLYKTIYGAPQKPNQDDQQPVEPSAARSELTTRAQTSE